MSATTDTDPALPVPSECWDAIRSLAADLNVEVDMLPASQWEAHIQDLAAPVVAAVVQDIASTATARWGSTHG